MSEDKPAETVEPASAEMNAIPNGKGHEPGEEITASAKEEGEKWVYFYFSTASATPDLHIHLLQTTPM